MRLHVQGFGARVARSVENFEHVMRLEEMARQRMSRRIGQEGGLDTGKKQGHYLRDLIISEATDWQVLTLHLAVHMQQLRSAIGSGASQAGQVCVKSCEGVSGLLFEVFFLYIQSSISTTHAVRSVLVFSLCCSFCLTAGG